MVTSTIPGISGTATTPASDDYLELGGNTNGSRKILASELGSGALDSGLFGINSATATQFTVSFTSTLPSAPTRFRLSFSKPSTSAYNVGGNWVSGATTTTNWILCLDGQAGDTGHQCYWEAFA